MAQDIGQKTALWHDKQWHKVLRAVVGTEIFQREPWLTESLNAFVKDNVALITSIKDDSLREIEGLTRRAIQGGTRHEVVAKEIQARFSKQIAEKLQAEGRPVSVRTVQARARLIARDQVAKLNGNLTMLRQQNIGVKKYIWETSGDRRVRPSHAAHEGETFSWDDPPVDTGHPGQDIQCVPGDSKLDMTFDSEVFFRRWYIGPLTTLVTESGESIHATPNHPILTADGWKPIRFVDKGDYLIKKNG